MLLIPTSYMSYYVYKNFIKHHLDDSKTGKDGGAPYSLGYSDSNPVNRFVKPHLSYWDWFRIYVASIIHDLLTDPTIE